MTERTIRGKTAIVGVGESSYYKHGQSPDREFVLVLKAILAAAKDAGIDAKKIDGFVSFSNDRNTAVRVANALGVDELRWSTMQWGGGGGGAVGAIQQATAAVAAGYADTVVVYRGLAQGEFGRFGGAMPRRALDSLRIAYGMTTPASVYGAARMNRFMHESGIGPETQRAIAMASYYHAQNNPRAVMHGKPLDQETYDQSRWIVEPFHLYDMCQENDGAAAVIVTAGDRAKDLTDRPVYVIGAAQGGDHRSGGFIESVYDSPDFATSEFKTLSKRLFKMAQVGPEDVDVVQSYENFTGAVVLSLIEHGFCEVEEANDFFTVENLTAPSGKLPLNTSGGNLAEAYIHGLGLALEGVRQLRGDSCNQVKGARVGLVSSGPMSTPTSTLLLGTQEVI